MRKRLAHQHAADAAKQEFWSVSPHIHRKNLVGATGEVTVRTLGAKTKGA